MKHLPGVCQMLGKWSGVFIPTLIYFGNQDEVWAIKDSPLSTTLQLIWDAIYKGIPYTVTTNRPVIAVVNREEFSTCLLNKSAFLFGTIKEDGSKHMEPFQSDLIMQVLSQHHCAISGALPVVPGITTLGHAKEGTCPCHFRRC
ncbi:hypothetical protein F4604DRAFT_1599378 [Suillus subluteus]|nr:hypothetical protein F4604DRAFT_1599378 [Suillus subluteus]